MWNFQQQKSSQTGKRQTFFSTPNKCFLLNLSLLAAAHKLPDFLFPFPLCLQVLHGYIMNLQVLSGYIMNLEVLPRYILNIQVLPGNIMNLQASTLSRLFISLSTISVWGQWSSLASLSPLSPPTITSKLFSLSHITRIANAVQVNLWPSFTYPQCHDFGFSLCQEWSTVTQSLNH